MKEADPEGLMFPGFTAQSGESMTRETKLLFDSVMREDQTSWTS